MSSVSIASPMRATTTTGNHSPMTAGEVEQQSKDTTSPASPRIGYATPPTRDVSKHHSSTTLESFRRKRLRINESYPATSHPLARSAGTCTGPVKLDLSNVPKNTFILATPDQVSMEMQYSNIGRARSVSHDNFTTDRILDSKSETLSENRHSPPRPTSSTLFPSETSRVTPAFFGNSDRNVTMSGMFLPIRDDGLEESPSQGEEAEFATMQTGRYRLRLKPKNLTVHHDFCRW